MDHHLSGMTSWQQPTKPSSTDAAAALYEYYDDDQYLFRLASTFGWDEVIALCESLVRNIEVAVSRLHHHHHHNHRGERQSEIENDSRGQRYYNSHANNDIDDDDDDSDSYSTYNDENYFNDSLDFFHGNENYKIGESYTPLLLVGDGGGDGVSVGDDFGRKQNSVHVKDVSASPFSQQHHHHHHHLRQCLLRAHSQLYYTDQWGNTPLHAASYVKPPLRVIEGMFQLGRLLWKYHYIGYNWHTNAKMGKMTPIWAQLCKDGSTPFLVACSTGASLSVLHCYLDEIEYYIEQQWVPSNSHYSKMAVLLPDNQGNSPIMGYMSFHHNWITRNSNEFHRPSHIHGDFAAAAASTPPSLREYWNFACRMLRFAAIPSTSLSMIDVDDDSTIALVHCCASIACHCPVSLLEWVVSLPPSRYAIGDADGMRWFPGDVCAATEDEEGKLPLHRALEGRGVVDLSSVCIDHEKTNLASYAGKKSSASFMPITGLSNSNNNNNVHQKLERNRLQIVQKLLRWYPLAASTALPNGRSPLVHAIAHGGSWHGIGSVMSTTTNGANNKNDNDAHLGLLQLLWRYSPEQSLEIDPVSGLYPFMLAATIALPDGSSSRPERSRCELIVLENVYNLLRQDPQVISLGLS